MLKKYVLAIFISFMSMQPVIAVTQDSIIGIWINSAGDGLIEISHVSNEYIGTIIDSTDPADSDRKDINNIKPDLRDRPLKGLKVIQGLRYTKDNLWTGASIYDPNNGKTYSCKVTLNDNKEIEIRGYIGLSIFGRTEIWKRAETSKLN
ncbi:DUF2147 domain-containing protein [Pseudomonadota bacterium]|nr:DUF2147 domain-containing protein [Pseudomonadota bacterium]